MLNNTVGHKIKQLRENAHIEPKDLASYLGITTAEMLACEADEKQFCISKLETIANLFGQSIRDLTNGEATLNIKPTEQKLQPDDFVGVAAVNKIAQNIKDMSEIAKNAITTFKFTAYERTCTDFSVQAKTEDEARQLLADFVGEFGIDTSAETDKITKIDDTYYDLDFDLISDESENQTNN